MRSLLSLLCHLRVYLALSTGCATAYHAPVPQAVTATRWTDDRGFKNGRFAVNGTLLHYIEFGGRGEPLVFLAGLGNSAHVFDDFAPRFTDRFHVIGLTRRGYGESGQPASGYETRQLAADVAGMLDSLHLDRVVLVGHSVAGDELTEVAASYPERVAGLVYLDAAYDRAGFTTRVARQALLGQLPPPIPKPSASDRESVSAYANYLSRIYGVRWPESEVRATRRFDGNGRYRGDVSGGGTNLAIARGTTTMAYDKVRAPVLAVYAVDRTIDRNYPWIRGMIIGRGNAQLQAMKAQAAERQWEREGRRRLAASIPGACIVELRDAAHYIFISHADTVEREIRRFLAAR